jgi:hypothetical protein
MMDEFTQEVAYITQACTVPGHRAQIWEAYETFSNAARRRALKVIIEA